MYSYVNHRNIRFLAFEVFRVDQLQQYPYFQEYNREACEMCLDAARQLADAYLFPIYREMDKKKLVFESGIVKTHPGLKKAIQALAEGGWIAAVGTNAAGGLQMPLSLLNGALTTFYAANANAASHAFLTQGASNLILSFGNQALQDKYLPMLYSGLWQGTMALTEPQAGSSLTDLSSSAHLVEEGIYRIKGQKIYISGGDHDAVDNVVHLLLARIEGAPAGTKGISLFVVPKLRDDNGQLVSNDVLTAGIFGKMGQRGYVAAHLMMGENDNCLGYLVGEPHKGLQYMFQMMNEARIGTGVFATGTSSGAYYASLKYAHERAQGRHPSNKDASQPPVLIIEHADVKRMLLFQKAVVEGSISLLMQCSLYTDLHKVGNEEAREKYHLLLELLTPVAKSYPSEMGIQSVSAGMQVLGGAGYCDDFPLEQYYRDIRVNAIYEGTTTIHGIDLMGRKITMQNGKALIYLAEEIGKTLNAAGSSERLKPFAKVLGAKMQHFQSLTMQLISAAPSVGAEVYLADATLYLEYFGILCIGWQWLLQAVHAEEGLKSASNAEETQFYEGKLHTMQYFFAYEIPKTLGLHEQLANTEKLTITIQPEYIN